MYTPTEVKQLITDYHWMRRLIDHQVYEYDSTSTSQYGIESSMPKAQGGTGDKVLVRVIRNDKDRRKTQELIDKVHSLMNMNIRLTMIRTIIYYSYLSRVRVRIELWYSCR
jgi:hypothetical protein